MLDICTSAHMKVGRLDLVEMAEWGISGSGPGPSFPGGVVAMWSQHLSTPHLPEPSTPPTAACVTQKPSNLSTPGVGGNVCHPSGWESERWEVFTPKYSHEAAQVGETRNLCYSATCWKSKEWPLIPNIELLKSKQNFT